MSDREQPKVRVGRDPKPSRPGSNILKDDAFLEGSELQRKEALPERDLPVGKTVEPAGPESFRHVPRWSIGSKRIAAVAGAMGALVGAVTAAVTMLLTVMPNRAPSTKSQAEITKTAIEPDVTLGQYFRHRPVANKLGWPPSDVYRPLLLETGTVVHFQFETTGIRGPSILFRWTLFDGDTGKRLAESEDLDPLFLTFDALKIEKDAATWEVWVNTSRAEVNRYFVRLELYDDDKGVRLTFADTEKFNSSKNAT